MKLSTSELRHLADLAIEAAVEAGQMVASSRPENVEHKPGGASLASQVVTEIDRRAEEIILDTLNPTLEPFELGLLTEEQEDDGSRFTSEYFWCIDPLDGTLPFIEGTPGYAVSIALVGRDGTPWIGVVYDPVTGTLFTAIRGAGAFLDRQPWSAIAHTGQELSVFIDRSFLASDSYDKVVAELEQIANALGLSGIRIHDPRGAVMNACGVLVTAPACYVKQPNPTGGGSLWDYAATACLFHELDAIATDISGNPLDLNRADSTLMNHKGILFASSADLARRLRSVDSLGGR